MKNIEFLPQNSKKKIGSCLYSILLTRPTNYLPTSKWQLHIHFNELATILCTLLKAQKKSWYEFQKQGPRSRF